MAGLQLSGGNAAALLPYTLDPRNAAITSAASVAGRIDLMRIVGGGPLRISRLGINVGTSSGNICLSVYSNSGVGSAARPTTLVGTTGSVACPAAGAAVVNLLTPVDVTPGMWFGLSVDNGTATFARTLGGVMVTYGDAFAVRMTAGGMPAPTTLSGLVVHGNAWMIIGLE